jgi:hypothetical protein
MAGGSLVGMAASWRMEERTGGREKRIVAHMLISAILIRCVGGGVVSQAALAALVCVCV